MNLFHERSTPPQTGLHKGSCHTFALQAINTAGLQPTLDDVNFVGTVFAPADLDSLPVTTPSVNLTKVSSALRY